LADTAPQQVVAYPVVEIEGAREDLEIALALLMEWGSLGAEERDDGSKPKLRAFFPEGVDATALSRALMNALPALVARPGAPEKVRDWLAEWKQSFHGFALGDRFFILPTWKPIPDIDVDRSILRIDPEQAFGTGTHETTRLAAGLLERLVRPKSRVIDLGSGTGILAMVAARLGADSVLAIEPDEHAARCARENVLRNGLAERVRVETAAAEDFPTIASDLVVANINRPLLESAVTRINAPLVVLSGILADELEELEAAVPARFAVRERWTSGEWAALVLVLVLAGSRR
jgi:ribosomal protein L11 methyltransferase